MATATVAQQLALEQLYIAYFGRAADPTGFAYWTGGLAAGTDNLQSIANEFSNSAESKALYPLLGAGSTAVTTQAATDFVTGVYFNLYHRAPDAVGLTYFVSRLTPTNAGDIIKGIADGAQGSDLTSLQARDLAGLNYTNSVTVATYTNGDSVAAVNGTFILTTGTDVATANIFTANLAFTPGGNSRVNTLQDEDQLTGVGTNPTLNATLGSIDGQNNGAQSSIITPKVLNGVETINAFFSGSAGSGSVTGLDLQNASATAPIKTFNITGITDNQPAILVKNFTAVPTNLGVANTSSPAGTVTFSVLDAAAKGGADATTLTLSNVNLSALNLNSGNSALSPAIQNKAGIENVTLVTAGAAGNSLASFSDVDLTKLTITGAGNLSISNGAVGVGGIDYGNQGKFTTIDGSTATGSLSIGLDSLDPAAKAVPYGKTNGNVAFTLTTGSGADTISSTIDFGGKGLDGKINDIVDAGSAPAGGIDTLALSQSGSKSFTDFATYNNFEAVTVTRTGSSHVLVDLTVDSTNVNNDPSFTLVNKETSSSYDPLDQTHFNLLNLSAAEATAITIKHSGKDAQQVGNNGLVNNLIYVTTSAPTVGVTIADGTNADPRFNFQLDAPSANVTLTDSDTESNTVQLVSFGSQTGTITLSGGAAGQFLNLDASVDASGSGYGLDTTGGDNTGLGGTQSKDLVGRVSDAGNLDPVVSGVYSADYRTTYKTSAGGEIINAAKITATGELADVIVRVSGSNIVAGALVGGQNIQLGSGNDTVIFANRGSNPDTVTTSGLSIADTVAGGAGQDTIILDGAGHQLLGSSEWQNLTGVDVLRLAGDPGVQGYNYNYALVSGAVEGEIVVDNEGNGGSGSGYGFYHTSDISGSYSDHSSYPSGSNLFGFNFAVGSGSGSADVWTPGTVGASTTGTPFIIKVTNQLVAQSDLHNNFTVINNDGNLSSGAENNATINLRELDAAHNVVFDGPNGNHWDFYKSSSNDLVFHAQQIAQVSDASANGLNHLDGGNPDFTYYSSGTAAGLTQAFSDGEWYNTRHRFGSNNNIYQVWNTSQVTASDLANTKNFDTIEFRSDLVAPQTLSLTLTDTVVHNLVQPLRVASEGIGADRLWIQAINNYDGSGDVIGYSQLNIQASALTSKSDLVIYASGNADTIISGHGNDLIYAFDPVKGDGTANNLGGAHINPGGNSLAGFAYGYGGEDYILLGNHLNGDTIDVTVSNSNVYIYGFDASKTEDVLNISGDHQFVSLETHNNPSGGGQINVLAGAGIVEIDNIFYNDSLDIYGGTTSLFNSRSGDITIHNTSTLNLGAHDLSGNGDIITILNGTNHIGNSFDDTLYVQGGITTLTGTGNDTIWFTKTATLDLGTHAQVDTIDVTGAGITATILNSYGSGETITVHEGTTTNVSGAFGSYSGGFAHHEIIVKDAETVGLGVVTIGLTHTNTTASGGTTISSQDLAASGVHETVVTGAIIGNALNHDTFDLVNDGSITLTALSETGTNIIPGYTGVSVDLNGVILLIGSTGHALDTGITQATEILNLLEGNGFTGGTTKGLDFLYTDNQGNSWIFEVGKLTLGGQIVELAGITNLHGVGTAGNQVHIV